MEHEHYCDICEKTFWCGCLAPSKIIKLCPKHRDDESAREDVICDYWPDDEYSEQEAHPRPETDHKLL